MDVIKYNIGKRASESVVWIDDSVHMISSPPFEVLFNNMSDTVHDL